MVIDDVEYRRDEKLIYTMKRRETVITREIMHVKRTLFFFFFSYE